GHLVAEQIVLELTTEEGALQTEVEGCAHADLRRGGGELHRAPAPEEVTISRPHAGPQAVDLTPTHGGFGQVLRSFDDPHRDRGGGRVRIELKRVGSDLYRGIVDDAQLIEASLAFGEVLS